jgi:prepilin-type N-terminal cleavage/methylation domain-containing protein
MFKVRDTTFSKGFTLVELLIVIAIISLLASMILSSLNTAQAKARDTRRQMDLDQVVKALSLYYAKNGDWISTASGCGNGGNGNGWFSSPYSPYKSIAQCLVDAGFTSVPIKDPTGGLTSTPTVGFSYMKYHCTLVGKNVAYIFAKLETMPQSTTATDGTCCAVCDSNYGMNYFRRIE